MHRSQWTLRQRIGLRNGILGRYTVRFSIHIPSIKTTTLHINQQQEEISNIRTGRGRIQQHTHVPRNDRRHGPRHGTDTRHAPLSKSLPVTQRSRQATDAFFLQRFLSFRTDRIRTRRIANNHDETIFRRRGIEGTFVP